MRSEREPVRRARRTGSVARAVAQFVVTGMVALALLGFLAIELLRSTGTSEAIRNAKELTSLAGDGIVAPAITSGVARGNPVSLAALDRLVKQRILRGPVVRVKVWDAAGRILYSDEPRLIGARYPLGEDELGALRRGGTAAELSDLSRPENRFERSHHELLEVYHGIRTSAHQRLLFETYQRYSSITASGQRLWLAFAPALISALFLLELAQVPLAWSLARRLRRGQLEREQLLMRAIESSELERRRVASDLHDGAVQDLAGISYQLEAAAGGIDKDSPASHTVRDAAAGTRRIIRELRSLLLDIYPPTLHRSGLAPALTDLLSRTNAAGLRTTLEVDPELDLSSESEALIFRTAQEALRNVRSHAEATAVEVALARADGRYVLSIVDDGKGFDPALRQTRDQHFGLRVMEDLARDARGRLTIDSQPGAGTTIRLEVPAT